MNSLPNPDEFIFFQKSLKRSNTFNNASHKEKKLKLQKVYKAINKNKIDDSYVYRILNKKFLDSIDDCIKKEFILNI